MKYTYWLLLLFFLSGCRISHKREGTIFTNTNDIKASILKETFVDIPLEMMMDNNRLYISDFRGDSLLWVYDIKRSEFIKRIVPRGEGPDEFLSPIQFVLLDSTMLIHNRWHYTAREYLLDSLNLELNPITKMMHLSTDIDMIYPVSFDKYVASGRFAESRYILFDKNGNLYAEFGDYPDYNEEEKGIPNFPKFMFHQSMFSYNVKKNILTSITSHVFELWDCQQSIPQLKKRVLLSPYLYEYKMGDEWAKTLASADTESGVQRIYSTDNYIYMLYDPNTTEMYRDNEATFNSEIWVFDWDGNPIKCMIADTKLICFCVDEYDKCIYCIINAPNPSIATFTI